MPNTVNLFKESKTEDRVFSVSEYLDFLNLVLRPCRAIVIGEIGEKINQYPGYSFFNLLDEDGSILRCFVFRSVIDVIGVRLEPGMKIKVFGYPNIRKNRGEMKFQVEKIELIGEGVLKKQFEILKKKLSLLGYFDPEKKKPLPRFARNIGLITSARGRGAKKDFLKHLDNFGFQIYFYDVKVEGITAVFEIKKAMEWFNENLPTLDVLVLIRGGGSWESLQPFNSEEIVKSIVASKIPVITGIGHEDDTTLADLAADLRVKTPTSAAKFLNENWQIASRSILDFEKNFSAHIFRIFENSRKGIEFFAKELENYISREIQSYTKRLAHFFELINMQFQNYFQKFRILEKEFVKNSIFLDNLIKKNKKEVENISEILQANQDTFIKDLKTKLLQEFQKLSLSSPVLKLKQGYSITFDKNGKIIKDVTGLNTGDTIKTKVFGGFATSKIKKLKK